MPLGIAFLLIMVPPASGAFPAAAPAQFCMGAADVFRSTRAECRPIMDVKVTAEVDKPRLFVLLSGDRKRLILGRLEPPSTSVDLSNKVGVRVRLRLESVSKEWPTDAELAVKSTPPARNEWHWTIAKDAAATLNSIELPPAIFEATIAAPHFEPVAFRVDARANSDLGAIRLRPLPLLGGKVFDRATHAPLAGAVVTSDAGKIVAVTNLNGEFREELAPDVNPAWVTISLAGYGTRTIVLAKTRADRTLPPIGLDRGVTLRVRVARETTKYPAVSVELARLEDKKQIRLKSGKLVGSNSEWLAQDLDAGEYIVIVSGDQPLQKVARSATVKAGESSTVDLEVNPIDLLGTVSRGSARLPAAEVTLTSSRYGWSSIVKTNNVGAFEEDLWQPGTFGVVVSAPSLTDPYFTADDIPEALTAHLDIVIPSGRVVGRVVDARSQQPVVAAEVTLDSILPENTKRSIGATADEDGRFAFEGVAPGSHTVTAEARNYLNSVPQSFDFSRDGESKQLNIALSPADRFPLVVTAPDGAPIVGASVIQSALLFAEASVTDVRGRVDIGFDQARGTLLMIVPKTGSFALYRIASGREIPRDPVQVTVSPPSASLTITTLDDTTRAPLRNIRILMRYNGDFIDPALARLFTALRGGSTITNEHGQFSWLDLPAGTYELWPYGGPGEAAEIMARQPRASATIALSNGPYAVTLRFDTAPRP